MEAEVTVIIINERGWQKPHPLGEGRFWVGTAEDAHIRLDDPGIAPYHLQLVNSSSERSVRLVNLSNAPLLLHKGSASQLFAPGRGIDLLGTERLGIGSYHLEFQLHKQGAARPTHKENKRRFIGVRLQLPDVVLRLDSPLVGVLTLQNAGAQACQFDIQLEGLPPECYEIAPLPLLHPGGEESSEIRFFHRRVSPPAGPCAVTLKVSAPAVYPGEEVIIQQTLKVAPAYGHSLSFGEPAAQAIAAPLQPSQSVAEPISPAPLPPEAPTPVVPPAGRPVSPVPAQAQSGQKWQVPPSQPAAAEAASSAVQPFTPPPPITLPAAPEPTISQPADERPLLQAEALPVEMNAPTSPVEAQPPAAAESQATATPALPEQPAETEAEAETEARPSLQPRRARRPDLSAARVMRANAGEFLDKGKEQG